MLLEFPFLWVPFRAAVCCRDMTREEPYVSLQADLHLLFFWHAFGPKSLETDQALDYGGKEDLVVST